MLSNLPNKTVLGGRWETTGLVGAGACAQVYKVRSTSVAIDYDLVAKVVPFGKSKSDKVQDRICNTLNYEYMMYNGLLSGFPFCPRVPAKYYGDDDQLRVRFLVMEQMDRDLESVSKDSTPPSPSAIARFGLQILEGLKWIHQRGFIFVDVKPANFMLKGDRLYFVDFGLVERMKVMPAGKTDPGRQFSGTPTFSSIATFNGEQPGAHDDIEAMGLVLLSLTMGGVLPWSTAKSDAEVKQMKASCDIKKLSAAQGVPEVGEIVSMCRAAMRTARPDYDAIQHLLNAMSTRKAPVAKAGAKTVSAASISSRSKASKPAAACLSVPAAEPVAATKPLSAAAQKRAAKLAAATAEEEAEVEVEVEVVPASASPPPKRSRKSRTAAAPSVEQSSAPLPPAAVVSALSDQKSGRTVNTAAAGPFSSSSSGRDAAETVEVASPMLGTRSRTRLSNSSAINPDESTGPFSASFKITSRSSRGRSLSPPPARSASPRATTAAATTSSTKAGPSTAQSNAVEAGPVVFEFRVTKGPCKGEVLRLDGPTRTVTSKSKRPSRAKVVSSSVVKSVGKGEDCDFSLHKDEYLSDRHIQIEVTKDHSVLVHDVGSRNGTKLNGNDLVANTPVAVIDGDVLRVGKTDIVCRRC